MNATTVAVDLAKSVFQLAVADGSWRVTEQQRLTRTQFERWFANRDVGLVLMESCGQARLKWNEQEPSAVLAGGATGVSPVQHRVMRLWREAHRPGPNSS